MTCPIANCQQVYFGTYTPIAKAQNNIPDYLMRMSTKFLTYSSRPACSDTISTISPDFVELYQQSTLAEANGLNTPCGCGYRRALEFLIKDYLICLRPDNADQIKRTQLGPLINTIDDPRIKHCAARVAWLGNDETHYVRQWDSMDLTNLKDLISLTLHYIEAEELSRTYEQEMPQGKK